MRRKQMGLGWPMDRPGYRRDRDRVRPLRKVLTRVLTVLLALRVVAAPIAARPDAPTSSASHRFVIRKCSWPVQRPYRATAASILRPSLPGHGAGPERGAIMRHPSYRLDVLARRGLSRLGPFF